MVSLYGKSCEDSGTGKMASGTGRKTAEPEEEIAEPPAKKGTELVEPTAREKRQVVWQNDRSFPRTAVVLCWTTCRIDRLPQ